MEYRKFGDVNEGTISKFVFFEPWERKKSLGVLYGWFDCQPGEEGLEVTRVIWWVFYGWSMTREPVTRCEGLKEVGYPFGKF